VEYIPIKGTTPTVVHFTRAAGPPPRICREVTFKTGAAAPKAGDQVLASMFAIGDRVDVIGTSRGKGFQGVVRRHHFAGGAATHGSMFHRAPGSIGASSYPSRVVKGMRAAGRMGGKRITTRNLRVARIDADSHLIVLRGAVPGAPDSVVILRTAIARKPDPKPQVEKPKKGKK
jgi:large subunit ribosomal protein L3